jgi:hypothetical protein
MKAPNSKHQAPEKLQASSFKPESRTGVFEFEFWIFSGAWMLALGIF